MHCIPCCFVSGFLGAIALRDLPKCSVCDVAKLCESTGTGQCAETSEGSHVPEHCDTCGNMTENAQNVPISVLLA